MDISFEAIESKAAISTLETEWRSSLTFPNEDYWEAQFKSCQLWTIKLERETIGYACVSESNTLYQFYIAPKYLMHGTMALEKFIKQREIKKAIIGTNNPIYLSLIMHFQKSIEIDGYTFKDMEDVTLVEREGEFRVAEPKELERLVNFQMKALQSSEESKDWFINYIDNWISRREFFVFEKKHEIIGTLEVRTSDVNDKVASLGMIVSPEYRNNGYGSYLLVKGKSIAKSRNIEPICACDKTNMASLKAIEKSGFRKLHLLLLVSL